MIWKKAEPAETDAKVIARARKNVASVERWGRWIVVLYTVLGIAFLAMIIILGNIVALIGNNLAANRLELWLGFLLGFIGGSCFYKAIHLLVEAWFMRFPDRRDRLLIQYHDALAEVVHSTSSATTERASDNVDLAQ